ncbi:type III PLP-dependent enzyme [Streptomyces sp. SID13666]|uniref:type III PLP-dependent enzyme n=1 Tax=Streptomyces TaxID=1883 RepID=UPI0011058850|nr:MULTISPECIES: type III PLP-dependent enzyme [Streptomyces]MCZ4096559.1 type III PLP-dependent enzyme [Streptomyces sp. H39-C1]NEA54893.1 type III PLP-dependent enzyme [Streptomyces sp. SID13666]NEA70695.1 type III PLP-dependent enzyme [Streptomyces sp. SID13588]QNA75316.1 type III PLP-dependent enzyme [Streptomyces sp. So13.3]
MTITEATAVVTDEVLVARYGSPLYVYDLDRVIAARDDLRAALPEQFTLFYSLKANPHPGLVRALGEGDGACRAEVCSTGELASALEAGHRADRILYSGPGKTAEEISVALTAGVRTFSVESLGDLQRLGAQAVLHGTTADALIRVNSAAAAATTSIRMTGTPSQFGFDAEGLSDLLPEIRAVEGIRVAGAHFFPLSNSKDEASLIAEFQETIRGAARLEAELGTPLSLLDIGGGFAAPYSVPGSRPVYGNLRAALEETLDEHFPRWRQGVPEIACESGRYLVGDSGRLLTTVTNVKQSRGRTFAVLDAGINTLGGMAGLGRLLPLSVEPKAGRRDGGGEAAEETVVTLAGPLCTPGDLLSRSARMPLPRPGDVIAVPNVGAYGPTASLLLFLGRPAPAEILLRAGEVTSASRLISSRAEIDTGVQ